MIDEDTVDAHAVSDPSSHSDSVSSHDVVAQPSAVSADAFVTSNGTRGLPPGVSQVDFEAALAIGRDKGQLTQAELIDALQTVELTPEVLTALIDRVTAEGVALVDDEEEDPIVEVAPRKETRAPQGSARSNGSAAGSGSRSGSGSNGSGRSTARRESNGRRASSGDSGGSAEDPVHTYLKEIGRV
ncbi:MAG TPA: RNA polymerase sigma factor region1.1 domain-containing protein, partial [Acidimicrobiales bacterium]|nr:RNA polymerase sigma factor region1.1 domain-containing protein [Acidimicrobiales bacterium]